MPAVRNPTAPNDAPELPTELFNLFRASDPEAIQRAWAEFLERHTRLLLHVAFRFAAGSYDEAMDSYAYMLDQLRRNGCARLRTYVACDHCTFATWLVVVCRRLCLDHHRRKYGRVTAGGGERGGVGDARASRRRLADLVAHESDLLSLADRSIPDPCLALDDASAAGALRSAVARLSAEDQSLLRLRFEQELTAREIATLVGLPSPFHVYRRLRIVCGVLRGLLEARPLGRSA
ncbi:MAG TPA: sigma-70 family RNA polymerase sigma factor [Gemmatimonadales bacterium]|nr:sigma-70 family RNA polymerase sigma factor [Gemmatimonadales bacterium]